MLLIVAYVVLAHSGASAFWFFLVTVCWITSLSFKVFIFGFLVADMQKEAKERSKTQVSLVELRQLIRPRFEGL